MKGLYGKYTVIDNETCKEVTDCFVLRPNVDPGAYHALVEYAETTYNPELKRDLKAWIAKIEEGWEDDEIE